MSNGIRHKRIPANYEKHTQSRADQPITKPAIRARTMKSYCSIAINDSPLC
ncbi:hypothetical protein [Syntrophaceticus schinkii]|uniref:hypothetical protein n=1 Tax=Syntrophaceticus schinkii TaxID=499207 RepID=UPI0018DBD0E4|nr:hypothetical protein [Syntrophaceticus schinkii]